MSCNSGNMSFSEKTSIIPHNQSMIPFPILRDTLIADGIFPKAYLALKSCSVTIYVTCSYT